MLITFLLIFVIIVPTYELFRKYRNLTTIFFLVVPILLGAIWINQDNMDWFKWVKVYSVSLLSLLINLTRYKKFQKNNKLFNLIYALSAINILEAMINDATHLDSASILNIFIGACLILTFLIKPSNMSVSNKKTKDFYAPNLTLSWIICYNIWDWVYIYGEYPFFAMRHIFVLGIPLIMEIFRPNTWLQIRVLTLSTYLIFSFTFSDHLSEKLPGISYNPDIALGLASINLLVLIYYFVSISKKLKLTPKVNFFKKL